MRFTRKTIMALSVSGAMTVVAGVSASAAVLGLPILGFGEAASGQAAPKVIHRTVYDDHYVTATTTPKAPARVPAAAGASRTTVPAMSGPGSPVWTAGPAPAAATAQAPTAAPAAVPAGDSDDPPVTTVPGATTPPPPAGCREPEWDPEHHLWQCSNNEVGG